MAILSNTANILFDNEIINSNQVDTNIDLPLTITKTANAQRVMVGQQLKYTIVINNPNDSDVTEVLFTDNFDDDKCAYVADSFTVGGNPTIPDETNPLTHTIDTITALGSITLEFDVIISSL